MIKVNVRCVNLLFVTRFAHDSVLNCQPSRRDCVTKHHRGIIVTRFAHDSVLTCQPSRRHCVTKHHRSIIVT